MNARRPVVGSGRLGRLDLAFSVALALAWAWFFSAVRTIGCGYHLTDDHEIFRIVSDLRVRPYLPVVRQWLIGDLSVRFRPFYFVHRVAEAAVFGYDLTWWSIYTALLAIVTSILLYLALRSFRFSPVSSTVFVLLGLCGPQAAIWWRLGPNETIGMVFLALALFGLARWGESGSLAWRAVFWAGTVVASLSKESFVALLPALILAAVWGDVWRRGGTWRQSVVRCLPELLGFTAVLVAEALVILLVVGTEKIGYAGARGVTPRQVWVAATRLLGPPEAIPLLALVVLAGLANALARSRSRPPGPAAALPALLLAALVVGGQAFLYAKPGLSERYLEPGSLSVAFLVASALRLVEAAGRTVRSGGRATGTRPVLRRIVAPALLVLGLAALAPLAVARIGSMKEDAGNFAQVGRETQAFLDAVARAPAGLVVAGGLNGVSEHFWSIHWYLAIRANRQDVRFFFVQPPEPLSAFAQLLVDSFDQRSFFPKYRPGAGSPPVGAVAVLRGDEEWFLRRATWFRPADYVREALAGSFALYTRRPPG